MAVVLILLGGGEGAATLGWAEATNSDSEGNVEESGDIAAGRGDERAGLGVGEAGAGGAGQVHDRADHPGHRPPPLHHPESRPRRRPATGVGLRDRHPRRAPRQGRPQLLRPPHPLAGDGPRNRPHQRPQEQRQVCSFRFLSFVFNLWIRNRRKMEGTISFNCFFLFVAGLRALGTR